MKMRCRRVGEILAALLIPVTFFLSVNYLFDIRGPNWIMTPNDYAYGYLLKGLALLGGKSLGILNHPGVPHVLLDAIVIKITFWMTGTSSRLAHEVLTNTELYTRIINTVILTGCCLALINMGGFVQYYFRSVAYALLAQACVFIFSLSWLGVVFNGLPETLQLGGGLVLGAVVIYALQTELASQRELLLFGLSSSLTCGFLVATKYTAAPLCLAPLLIMPGYKNKGRLLLGIFCSFIIFILPAFSSWPALYGDLRGSLAVVSTESKMGSLRELFHSFLANGANLHSVCPCFAQLLSLPLLIMLFILTKRTIARIRGIQIADLPFEAKTLIHINLSILLFWATICLRPQGHYLLTAVGLLGLSLILGIKMIHERIGRGWGKAMAFIFILIIIRYQYQTIPGSVAFYKDMNSRTIKANKLIEAKYSDWPKFYTIPFNSKIVQLEHALQCTHLSMAAAVAPFFPPNAYIYNWDGHSCHNYKSSGERNIYVMSEEIKKLKKALFLTSCLERQIVPTSWYKAPKDVRLVSVFKESFVEVYEVYPLK